MCTVQWQYKHVLCFVIHRTEEIVGTVSAQHYTVHAVYDMKYYASGDMRLPWRIVCPRTDYATFQPRWNVHWIVWPLWQFYYCNGLSPRPFTTATLRPCDILRPKMDKLFIYPEHNISSSKNGRFVTVKLPPNFGQPMAVPVRPCIWCSIKTSPTYDNVSVPWFVNVIQIFEYISDSATSKILFVNSLKALVSGSLHLFKLCKSSSSLLTFDVIHVWRKFKGIVKCTVKISDFFPVFIWLSVIICQE